MPPRSVCLNVFTTSLGSGIPKEAGMSLKEVAGAQDVDMKEHTGERTRHDSVQGSLNDTITSPHYTDSTATSTHTSPTATTHIDISSFPADIARAAANESLSATPLFPTDIKINSASTCSTCGQLPATGLSLQRCSRCKSAYYCSKTCQKAAWKLHKLNCRGGSASSLATPNISTPGSPTNVQDEGFNVTTTDGAVCGEEMMEC